VLLGVGDQCWQHFAILANGKKVHYLHKQDGEGVLLALEISHSRAQQLERG